MADLPTPHETELAELLGSDAGKRELPPSMNPWSKPQTPKERVLSFRWRNSWAGASSDQTFFGELGDETGEQ